MSALYFNILAANAAERFDSVKDIGWMLRCFGKHVVEHGTDTDKVEAVEVIDGIIKNMEHNRVLSPHEMEDLMSELKSVGISPSKLSRLR